MKIVSACLVGINCRHDAKSKPCQKVINLVKQGKAIPVCPEQLGGLTTPQNSCRTDKGESLQKKWGRHNRTISKRRRRGAKNSAISKL